MKVQVIVDADVLAAAEWAMAAHVSGIAKHMTKHPASPFNWGEQLKLANDQLEAFKAAAKAAQVVAL